MSHIIWLYFVRLVVSVVRGFRVVVCKLKILMLRARGCDVHFSAKIHPSSVFELSGGSVAIGPRTHVDRGVIVRAMGGCITIGADCSLNAYSFLSGAGGILIGDSVMVGSHVSIYSSNHRFALIDQPMNTQGLSLKGVCIERDVWIGTGVRILDGVTVKTGSVLGAGSVVTHSTNEFSINAGVPAREIGNRRNYSAKDACF